jgi:hypothetical protein
MKNSLKFLLIICLCFTTLGLFAQKRERATMIQTGVIDSRTGKITWSESVDVDLIFTLDGSDLYIDDKANTHIKTYGKSREKEGYNDDGDEFVSYSWDAYDEKNRSCIFSMTLFKKLKIVTYVIRYNDVAFRYYIKNSLSNFSL